jgi:diadenosine tetraphosphatase ApaH/serine/threonine PP2A family protein phosphatase
VRVAVVADVHGNLPALEAVLADIETQAVDRLIVNGDLANRGPDTGAVFHRLADHLGDATLGNHDDLMLIATGRRGPADTQWLDDPFWGTVPWSAQQLEGTGNLEAIERLPMTIKVEEPGAPSLLFSHGSPRHYREGYGVDLSAEVISEITESHPAAVGCPFNGDARAHYLILTLTAGEWVPDFRRVPYDRDAALQRIRSSGMLETTGLSAMIFYEEFVHASSFLVPFLMWCETDKREKTRENWDEFRKRFDVRFRQPDTPTTVRSSRQP